jgi:hypothetical protein
MKTTIKLFAAVAIMLLLMSPTVIAQERPAYVTATTMHWNMDNENFKMAEWIAVEKEYLDKVTKKNEHVVGAGFYLHRYSPDNTELIYVQVYPSWEAIDKASGRNDELAKAAWPDKAARDAFFKKQGAYYSDDHSDEIYATLGGAKPLGNSIEGELILYVQKNQMAYPDDGTEEEFNKLRMEFTENVLHKNELIKAYYPNVHAWGSDRTEFLEAFYVSSMADLDKMGERNNELAKAYMPDEAKREAFGKKYGKYFTGVHGDYIYSVIKELRK